MKKIFTKIKTDIKFARAGEGHKLTEDTRTRPAESGPSQPHVRNQPLSSSQINAGSAALARHEEKSRQTKTVVPKVIKSRPAKEDGPSENTQQEISPSSTPRSAVESTVCFISPFTDEVVKKADLQNHIREHLIMRLCDHGATAAVQMMKTLNKSPEKVQFASETISRYIDNILAHPGEEKYQKIRKNNKVFSEKVSSVEGAEEFLEVVGFNRTIGENDEIYFVFGNTDIESLKSAKETLQTTERLQVKIHRDKKFLLINDRPPAAIKLSNDFFKLTSQEVKQEQIARTEEIELNKQLRTKAMRQGTRTSQTSRYTIIRIKFPDAKILQGTFRASESVKDLNEFIRENINVDWAMFVLKTSLGQIISDETSTLQDADLVPTALLNLVWNEEIRLQVKGQQHIDLSLKS